MIKVLCTCDLCKKEMDSLENIQRFHYILECVDIDELNQKNKDIVELKWSRKIGPKYLCNTCYYNLCKVLFDLGITEVNQI